MQELLWACVLLAAATAVCVGSPERGKEWDALITEAKARGAEETRLDQSASYVFQREDGSYVTFTRLLATDKGRSICLIGKELTETACVDWDTGQLKLGRRADAATPWKFYSFESLEALEAAKPGFVDQLVSSVNKLLVAGSNHRGHSGSGCYRVSKNGVFYRVPSVSC